MKYGDKVVTSGFYEDYKKESQKHIGVSDLCYGKSNLEIIK